MDPQKTIHIKEEETDCALDERGLMSYGTLDMDHQQSTYIKKEESDCAPDEPGLMFPEDPLKTEVPGLPIKPDPELKWHVATSENNSYGTLAVDYQQTTYIKEEETDCAPDEPGLRFPEDPLKPEVPGVPIKPDPELKFHVATSENNVTASRNYSSNSTRLLQSNERCDLTVEETVSQGVIHNELNIGTEKSPNFIMFREGEEEENESLSAPRLTCSLRENKCQTFICSVCQQRFNSKYGLMMHVFVHIDGVELPQSVCKSCGEVFPSYVSLKKHLKISEAEQDSFADKKTFDCSGKSFTQLSTLKDLALIQTGRKSHKCDICSKSFMRLSDLKCHTLIHTGTRPHSCDNCGKSFTRLSHLKRHALVHSGIKPHKCDICGKSFTQLTHLKSHALIHTGTRPHKCDICSKSFTDFSTHKRHILIHTGIKPHKCDICGKSFTQLSHLNRHILIHTGTYFPRV